MKRRKNDFYILYFFYGLWYNFYPDLNDIVNQFFKLKK